jgi:predicted RNA-binding Zn-ribbon protein involved in translation (DUF1610 family)
MSDAIRFACPECGEKLKIQAIHAGRTTSCPKCAAPITVPEVSSVAAPTPSAPAPATRSASVIYCVACGMKNSENNFRCVQCGAILHASPTPAVRVEDPLLALVPYKNAAAVWAYYLGVFALIPCFGILLAIAAIIAGVMGLGNATKHPEAKGKVHAWVGIILGMMVLFGHIAAVVVFAVLSK